MSFLPTGYEAPKGGGKYMKLAKGENRFRILSKPILGYEAWTHENKPVRKGMGEGFDLSKYKQEPKHFWAFIVWNYEEDAIQILQITQFTIQDAIKSYSEDKEWGDPFGYDLKVIRTGDGLETKYQVTPMPHKELSPGIKKKFEDTPIDLSQLFKGLDPFGTENLHGVIAPEEEPGGTYKEDESELPF